MPCVLEPLQCGIEELHVRLMGVLLCVLLYVLWPGESGSSLMQLSARDNNNSSGKAGWDAA